MDRKDKRKERPHLITGSFVNRTESQIAGDLGDMKSLNSFIEEDGDQPIHNFLGYFNNSVKI